MNDKVIEAYAHGAWAGWMRHLFGKGTRLSVYVVIALDGHEMKECVVLSDHAEALGLYHRLQAIWGGEFVAMASRQVNEIPLNIVCETKEE